MPRTANSVSKKSSSRMVPLRVASYKMQIQISYQWSCDSFPEGIPQPLREALDETAQERIFEQASKGFLEGELIDHVNMKIDGFRTPGDGFYCRGWWSTKTEAVPA